MLFINILLLFLYEMDSYESTSWIYGTLTNLYKLSSLITLAGNINLVQNKTINSNYHRSKTKIGALKIQDN